MLTSAACVLTYAGRSLAQVDPPAARPAAASSVSICTLVLVRMRVGRSRRTCADICGLVAQVDQLQHEADLQLQQLRREIDQAIVKGLQRSRHE